VENLNLILTHCRFWYPVLDVYSVGLYRDPVHSFKFSHLWWPFNLTHSLRLFISYCLFCVIVCFVPYCLFCVVLCIVCVYMCTELLPPGDYPIAVKYTGCFKKSFTTLKAYRNLYRGHTRRFELSKCSKTHWVLPRIVIRNCFDLFFRFLLPHYQWKSH
jgi:hypothetical protein